MNGFSERSRKGWEARKAMQIANGYGPNGSKRGTERHKVKSFAEIAERVRLASNHESGQSLPHTDRMNDAGGELERKFPVAAREPVEAG